LYKVPKVRDIVYVGKSRGYKSSFHGVLLYVSMKRLSMIMGQRYMAKNASFLFAETGPGREITRASLPPQAAKALDPGFSRPPVYACKKALFATSQGLDGEERGSHAAYTLSLFRPNVRPKGAKRGGSSGSLLAYADEEK
jgi:hypothetical protein